MLAPPLRHLTVLAPHPDDETLGCGGLLLLARAAGLAITWLVGTEMDASYSAERKAQRERELDTVASRLGATVVRLGYPCATLDEVPTASVVAAVAKALAAAKPDWLLIPFRGDAHSDHTVLADAAMAAAKPFRAPWIHRIWSYEVPSETDQGWRDPLGFRPNAYVDIADVLDAKLALVEAWGAEIGAFPHPRSREAVLALARTRGLSAGYPAAEAFMVVRERWGSQAAVRGDVE
jgi:LmbE family N-acetylglucosaminyl deacetylase